MDSHRAEDQSLGQAESVKNQPEDKLPINSLRFRLLFLLLGIGVVIAAIITAIAVYTTRQQGQQASQISSQALQHQAETYLQQITERNANENDLTLELLRNSAIQLANFVAEVYDNPQVYISPEFWQFDQHMFMGNEGQFLNGEADLSSVFIPYFQDITESVKRDVELGGYLELQMKSLYESNPSITAIYYASQNEVTRYYPNIRLGLLVPKDFTVTQRVWYTDVAPDNNPEGKALWSPVYVDATGQGLVTTASAPVYSSSGEFLGVVGFDVTLVDMTANVEATRVLQSGYTFLMDQVGQSVALPEQGYLDILGRASTGEDAGVNLAEASGVFSPIIREMLSAQSGFQRITTADEILYVAYAPLKDTGWSLGTVAREGEVLSALAELQADLDRTSRELVTNRILPAAGILFVVVAGIGWALTSRMVNPIQKLVEAAQQVSEGQWDVAIPQSGRDEIGKLGRAFASMTGQLRQTVYGLEQQVAERTTAAALRSTYLQAAADVGRAAATLRNLDELLPLVTRLISEQFGFYHVGIFLLDESKEYVVLRASNSPGGQRMVARGHRLQVGQQGIVGYVTGRREPRIALNVGEDSVFFNNPDLPETQSEMALPLVVGTELLGALDVQSTQAGAFKEQDVRTLQVLADQVAIAINSARLVQQLEQVLESERRAYGLISEQAWFEQTRRLESHGYTRTRAGIMPLKQLREYQEKLSVSDGQSFIDPDNEAVLYVPVKIRGQVIGGLKLTRAEEGQSWHGEDIKFMESLAAQLGLSLESARAYQATQFSAQRERILSDIGTRVRETLDIDSILRTTTQELRKALGLPKVVVKLGASPTPVNDGGNGHGKGDSSMDIKPQDLQSGDLDGVDQGGSHE
jgi:GAF domain-containing protein/HAMP domain-containing protein/cell division protein FtsL